MATSTPTASNAATATRRCSRAARGRLRAADGGPAGAIDETVQRLNDTRSPDGFLDRQNYRLAHWRSGAYELDYRRFFDINTLVGLRMDDPRVFDERTR